MDTLLIGVTAVSLAMAVGLAMVVLKLVRDDRRRSEARVLALSAMSAAPDVRPQRSAAPDPAPAGPRPRPVAEATTARVHTHAARLDDLEIRRAEPVASVGDLFAEKYQPSPWGRRVAVSGVLAAAIAAIGFLAVSSRNGKVAPAPAPAASQTAPAADPLPLELLSLRHLQQAQTLTVTGLVQNPRAGAPLSGIVATAFVFGPDGTFLSSSRAPLDFTTLRPGDESPFVVTVPVTGVVSRYRIGFRAEDGRVIAHVDKRAPDAVAGLR
jgi:hypothetical protein